MVGILTGTLIESCVLRERAWLHPIPRLRKQTGVARVTFKNRAVYRRGRNRLLLHHLFASASVWSAIRRTNLLCPRFDFLH